MEIDWKRVNENLRCPKCGDAAAIEPGTDGTWGNHMHRFPISRAQAERLSRLSQEEILSRIKQLETELKEFKGMVE